MSVDLDTLIQALQNSWAAETSSSKDWSQTNASRGQCVPTSLVLQDYLGGEIIKCKVIIGPREEKHYYNRLSYGLIIDATIHQYTEHFVLENQALKLNGFKSAREKRLSDKDTLRRYLILKESVERLLTA